MNNVIIIVGAFGTPKIFCLIPNPGASAGAMLIL
jgi:hypothetical protein